MNRRLETSDPYYDARTSSMSERLKHHLEELADQPAACVDNDYLKFHLLLAGQSIEQQAPVITSGNPDPAVGDLPNDDGDGMHDNDVQDRDISPLIAEPLSVLEGDTLRDDAVQDRQAGNVENGREQEKRRNERTEIDREYSILAANILLRECNIPGNENGELNIERDQDTVLPPLILNVRRRVRNV